MSSNLWPDDIATVALKAPAVILREQASNLGERTKNIVIAEVKASIDNRNTMSHLFYIVAPALDNYRYRLFSVDHHVTSVYPVDVYTDPELYSYVTKEKVTPHVTQPIRITDEQGLINLLGIIFGADKTRRIVASLLAQSEGLEPTEDEPGI